MTFKEDLVQFYPNRLTVSRPRVRDWQTSLERKAGLWPQSKNLLQRKKSVNLSAASRKAIRDSIFSMYQLSPARTVKAVNGKFIYNFRQSFVTLTLPSPQVHSDVILKKCLDHFLTNLRRAFKIENYVWKAELQVNENIHFHLSFDKFVHYQAIRYYWLLAIKPYGYVDAYTAKFSSMSLSDYAAYRKIPTHEAHKPYEDGRRSGWQSPNCVDVSAVTTAASVSNYLSKYFAKGVDTMVDSPKDLSLNSTIVRQKQKISIRQLVRYRNFGKVWARSQSLSRLKYINKFEWSEVSQLVERLVRVGALHKVSYDFSTVFYFNFKKLVGFSLAWISAQLRHNAIRYLYPFPS